MKTFGTTLVWAAALVMAVGLVFAGNQAMGTDHMQGKSMSCCAQRGDNGDMAKSCQKGEMGDMAAMSKNCPMHQKGEKGEAAEMSKNCPMHEKGMMGKNHDMEACAQSCNHEGGKKMMSMHASTEAEPVAAASEAAVAESKPQTRCPVMGGEINKDIYVDVDGKRVYFCCPNCIEKFKADAAKYIQEMEAEGIALEKTPS